MMMFRSMVLKLLIFINPFDIWCGIIRQKLNLAILKEIFTSKKLFAGWTNKRYKLWL